MPRQTPSYQGLRPSSEVQSRIHARCSKKSDTKPEQMLRSALFRRGLRYRKNVDSLPGKPDIVFPAPRVVVFCDGDFWHGRDWESRKARLAKGSNPDYWLRKIETNMARDQRRTEQLEAEGWTVMRIWETDVKKRLSEVVDAVAAVVEERRA